MSTFIFMLTQDDETIPNALQVYETVRETDVGWVGFKDVGVPAAHLKELCNAIRADGRQAVLEVVSLDEASEAESVRVGMDLGVDLIMGGTRPSLAGPVIGPMATRYFPFVGEVAGHPSVLEGDIDQIAAGARRITERDDVDGLDLLAYRHAGDSEELIRKVVAATGKPVVVAGSIDSPERITKVAAAGAWGFTIGSAILSGQFAPGLSIPRRVQLAVGTGAR
jgi:hypothetical protein